MNELGLLKNKTKQKTNSLAFGILSSHTLKETPTDNKQEHVSSSEKEGFLLEQLLPPSVKTEVERLTVSLTVRKTTHWSLVEYWAVVECSLLTVSMTVRKTTGFRNNHLKTAMFIACSLPT